MMITSKGQITIPAWIRERKGLLPHTEVEFVLDGEDVKLVKASQGKVRGKRLIDRLRGKGSVAMSTDEIMALTRGDS